MSTNFDLFIPGGRTGFLLLHGLSGTPVEMRYIANGLARAGYTVSVPRLAGHCGTLEELRNASWKDWVCGAEQALAELGKRCDHVFVGGLSMGAVLALKVAARNPDLVRGTACYAPTLWLNGWGVPWHARLFALVHQKWFADLFNFSERHPFGIKDTRLRKLIADALESGDTANTGFLSIPGGLFLELRYLVNSVRRDLGSITQPTLLVHPREDDRADISNSIYLQKHLGGRVETVILEDSYHVITMDRQRDVVLTRTEAFAKSVMAGFKSGSMDRARARPIAAA